MERLKPTRSELLKTRKRIRLAKKGHELLKKKQDSLVMEFFELLKGLRDERERLQKTYTRAQRMMNEVRALESDLRISSASLLMQQEAPVEITVRNIAGVRVPEISRVDKSRSYPKYHTIMIQDLGLAYQEVVDLLLSLAARETAVRKMLIEIKKTKRRAYALENILIPRLETGLKHIRFELEEREREEFNRLKRRKNT